MDIVSGFTLKTACANWFYAMLVLFWFQFEPTASESSVIVSYLVPLPHASSVTNLPYWKQGTLSPTFPGSNGIFKGQIRVGLLCTYQSRL